MLKANVCPVDSPNLLPLGSPRLAALDALRGLSVASMILVISPGRWEFAPQQLQHAAWVGTPYADMIFPTFLVSVGVAMTLSFAKRLERGERTGKLLLHVLQRSAVLFVLGLLLNLYDSLHWATVRIPGVLQRIAICYLLGSLVYLPLRDVLRGDTARALQKRLLAVLAVIALLLTVYGLLLRFVPVPGFGPNHLDSNGNLGAWLDRKLFTVPHLWPYGTTAGVGVTFDPEGLLSSVPALATLLMGVFAGELLRWQAGLGRRTGAIAAAGLGFLMCGFLLEPFVPFIKKIWTPSFACFSGGVALLALSLLLYVIDVRGWRGWSWSLRVFGSNAILAFVFSWVILIETGRHRIAGLKWNSWLYDHLGASWIGKPQLAAFVTALCVVLVNLALLVPFYRRRWLLRV